MLPAAFTVTRFRSFAVSQEIELRPLTLLFGRNGSGKSALLRALPLIADSIDSDRLDGLDLDKRLKPFDLDFGSLRTKGLEPTDERTLSLALRWGDGAGAHRIEWAIGEQDGWSRLVVKRLVIEQDKGGPGITADWELRRGEDEAHPSLTYELAA